MTEEPTNGDDNADDNTVEIPDNADVEPGDEPQPESAEEGGAQDDGSEPVADDDQEPEPVSEPADGDESADEQEG